MKYIFVCNYKQSRSPTAVRVAGEMALERSVKLETEAFGLFPEETEAQDRKDGEKLQKADRIFVMTSEIGEIVKQRYRVDNSKMVCLDIEDDYDLHGLAGVQVQIMLENILREKLDKFI